MKQIILIFSLIIFNSISIYACGGILSENYSKAFSDATEIFIGKVVNVTLDTAPRSETQRYPRIYRITFKVQKNWKDKASEITVISDNGKSPCGRFEFQKNKKYIVFAQPYENNLAAWTTRGYLSRPFDKSDIYTKALLKELDNLPVMKRTRNK